jgi:hypothetical protein
MIILQFRGSKICDRSRKRPTLNQGKFWSSGLLVIFFTIFKDTDLKPEIGTKLVYIERENKFNIFNNTYIDLKNTFLCKTISNTSNDYFTGKRD